MNKVIDPKIAGAILKNKTMMKNMGFDDDAYGRILSSIQETSKKRFAYYKPYNKQREFHNSKVRNRLMSGGNQTGKTFSCCHETAMHATGIYPEWYEGEPIVPRLDPITGDLTMNIWVIGTDSQTVKDVLQAKLIGTIEKDYKDGIIHHSLVDPEKMIKSKQGKGALTSLSVRHSKGFDVKIFFKSYEQGRKILQSATIDLVYLDEEPPLEIAAEIIARTTATKGRLIMGFTPLMGMTEMVSQYWKNETFREQGDARLNLDQLLICMNLYEADHMTPDMIASVESSYRSIGVSEKVIKARMMGIPAQGVGAIYPYSNSLITGVRPFPGKVPSNWKQLGAIDFGRGEHDSAFVVICKDPLTNIMYLWDALKTKQGITANAKMLEENYGRMPFTYPHDLMRDSGIGGSNEDTDTRNYKEWYESKGVNMTSENAKTIDGSIRVETGLMFVRKLIEDGKLKVAPHLSDWFEEKEMYAYGDDGKPKKKKDDLMDATRYCLISFDTYALTEWQFGAGNGSSIGKYC